MLKRLTILCIGLILGTLLIAPNAFCGTDDSGLQVYTLNFGEMMGETADVGQEDTKISQYCYNMFQSGNGLCSYPQPKGSGYEWTGTPIQIFSAGNTFVKLLNQSSSVSCEVYLHSNSIFASPTGTRTLITNNGYSNGDLFNFQGLTRDYLFVGFKMIYSADNWATTAEVTLPTATSNTAALWQNRLWIASGRTMYYSAAQDYENFTNSATAGGTTNILGIGSINKLVGTRYGLFIFTSGGIFLQSGASKGWSIEKISDLFLYNSSTITSYNDNIFFQAGITEGRKIFVLSGTTISVLAEFPEIVIGTFVNSMAVSNSGKLLLLSFGTSATMPNYVYDLEKKSWSRSAECHVLGYGQYFAKKTSTGKYAVYFYNRAESFNLQFDGIASYVVPLAWEYKTSWMTLDGNAGNRKEIDRIEFDFLGGTAAVGLYFATGDGSYSGYAGSLVAPTNSRFSSYTWNNPIGKRQSNRFYLDFASVGAQTMTQNYVLKQARIYYRNIGNYKTNTLR